MEGEEGEASFLDTLERRMEDGRMASEHSLLFDRNFNWIIT